MAANGLRRTSLYASGASPVNMLQAQFYNADCLVYDLEDSVPPEGKDAARFLVYNILLHHRPAEKHIVVRVNPLGTIYFDEDIEAIVRARPDAIRLPKVESANDVRMASEKIEAVERKAGIEPGAIKLWCNLESYLGVLRAEEIATASPRIIALALSAEDFTASMRSARTKPGWEIFHARNLVLMASRKAGVDAQDAVFADINDMEGLREDMEMSKTLGFDGKTVIHPRQIDIVNSYFTPSKKEINYALRVFDAIDEARSQNKGAVALDGNMIDEPIVVRARTVLAMARAAGIRVEGDYYDR